MASVSFDRIDGRLPARRWPGGIDSHLAACLKRLCRRQPDAVTLRATFEAGEILLDLIKVEPERRGEGLASGALRGLLSFADRWALPVRLQAISLSDPDQGLDEEALLGWYGRLGFSDTGDRSASGLTIMRREPAALYPCAEGAGHLHGTHRHLAGLSGRRPPPGEGRSFALPKHR